jgi:hypothetical protein
MYVHGLNQHSDMVEPELTWLDYLIISNPQGVMKVLAGYGYTGYLAPQDQQEMYEVCMDLMSKRGDIVIVELLKSHPLYEIICDISKEETRVTIPLKNTVGNDSLLVTTIRTINYHKLIENALIIIGAAYLILKLFGYSDKNE